jgi:hypothetical protein
MLRALANLREERLEIYSHNQPPWNQPVESKLFSVPAAPLSLAQSPPPTQYQPPTLQPPVTEPPVTPTLAQPNSLSYTSTTPVSHLARNNTLTSPAHTQQYIFTQVIENFQIASSIFSRCFSRVAHLETLGHVTRFGSSSPCHRLVITSSSTHRHFILISLSFRPRLALSFRPHLIVI